MILFPWQRRQLAPCLDLSSQERQDILVTIPVCNWLLSEERARLLLLAEVFLAEKNMEGVQGMVLHPWMQWVIALQACLPILNLGARPLASLKSIIVYSGDFVPPWEKTDEIGVVHPAGPHRGESWRLGPVVLSWQAILESMVGQAGYGENVIIHEIAHQLDGHQGGVDGVPALPWGMSRSSWIRDFSLAFMAMKKQFRKGKPLPLDPYALESPAEFFAVACESFFVAPWGLQESFPAVYAQLVNYFRMDPAGRGECRNC